MRRADLETREAVERAVEDQVRQSKRRLQRSTDDVEKRARATHAFSDLGQILAVDLRVDEDHRLQLLGLCPERIEAARRKLLALDAPADRGATKTHPHGLVELLRGEIRKLHRDGGEGRQPIRLRRAHLGHLLILDVHHPSNEVPFRPEPEGVDAHHLHIDALPVHVGKAVRNRRSNQSAVELEQQRLLERRPLHDRQDIAHRAMAVNVDRPHAAAVDGDRALGRSNALRPAGGHAARDADNSRRDSAGGSEELPAALHCPLVLRQAPSCAAIAIVHGRPERLLHAWLVPRWTTVSPARRSTSSVSRTSVISPSRTMQRSRDRVFCM
jgi:hypothetical protein